MSNVDKQVLENKRLEVIRNLISATESGRLEWEATGDGGYYAQPNAMGVRINQNNLKPMNILSGAFSLELLIFDNQGNRLDEVSARADYNEHIYDSLNSLMTSIKDHKESNVARDLDRFLEDLRA